MSNLLNRVWNKGLDYPEWMTEPAIVTLKSDYIPEGYTPRTTMQLVGRTVELELGIEGIADKVFQHLWDGNIGLSSPIWSNFGRKRGLPISCFNSHINDSILDFKKKDLEIAIMSKNGGGTSAYLGDVRGRGESISNTMAKANGVMSPVKMIDNTIQEVSQGGVRRGMLAGYLDFSHQDIMEFLDIREVGHDIQTITTGVIIDKTDIDAIMTGDTKALDTWAKILEKRNNIGVPYIYFKENCQNSVSTPEPYKQGNVLKASNLCSEIILPSKKDESFVCCLLSMNLARYDEWKNTDAVEIGAYILEAVLNEFIRKASKLEGMESAVRFAERHRAIGIGTFGEHTYFQQNKIPFLSLEAEFHRKSMYKNIRNKADKASIELADIFGACDVNAEYGIHKRFTTTMAVAPTTTNALICGEVSPGIEPLVSNVFQRKVAKGSFTAKNKFLIKLLREKEMDTAEVWQSIIDNFGSVQHLEFLTDEEKQVFLTAYEMNQFDLVKQASIRQRYIDQSQSLNLFVLPDTPAQVRSDLYLTAYFTGVKTLYYQRSLSNLVEDKKVEDVNNYFKKVASTAYDNGCTSCEG
jgi:ribonucleoside-diphosphate reductase alpha chain